jgi:O-antigen ligase
MRQFLLITLFTALLVDIMFGSAFSFSLAPGLSLKNAMLYLLFTALVLEYALTGRDPLRETWPLHVSWGLLAFYATFTWLTLILLGVHREYDGVAAFIALKSQLVDLFLFFLLYLYAPKDISKSIVVLRWLIGLLILVNTVTFIDFLNMPNLGIIQERFDGRLAGPVQEVNQYGAILIFLIPLLAGLAIGMRGASRGLYAFGTVLAVVLLGLTVSRGSWVGLFIGGCLSLFLVRNFVRKGAIIRGVVAALLVLVVTGIAIAIVNPEGFLGKFEFSGTNLDGFSSGRVDAWQRLLTKMSYWPYSFLTGYGWDAYKSLIGIIGDPHNTYLLYWFNLGLIGLGLYIFVVIWIVRYAVNSLPYIDEVVRPLIIGFITGFLALHVAIFFVVLYTPWLFIWALTGTILRIVVDEKQRTTNREHEGTLHNE